MTDKKTPNPEDGEQADCPRNPAPDFPIRDFPDLRRLRKIYLKKDDKPIIVDSTETPRPDDVEEDFGLTRSTVEEAWEFLRESLREHEDDELTEFLDDK